MTLTVEMNWMGVTSDVASGVTRDVTSRTKTQLIVVDASLPRLDILLADLAPEKSVLRVEPHQDAVACISEALTHSPAQSLAIVAHGTPGEVRLGRGGINHSTLMARGAEIQGWGVEEIQLFSCHTGAAAAFVETLEQLSGASVFASESAVGHEMRGGHWLLSTQQGVISTAPFSAQGKNQWHFTLVPLPVEAVTASELPMLTGNFDSYALTIPDGTLSVGDSAFQGLPVSSVTIPDSVTEIGSQAFFAATRLTSVTIPNSVISIGRNAFAGTPLTSVTIGESVTSIGDRAFERTQLTSVTIPDSVTTIADGTFLRTPLTSVTIGESVTSIGIAAFARTQLTSVTIPDSVTSIGRLAFADTDITSVTLNNDVNLASDAFPPTTQIIRLNPTLTANITLDDPTLTAGETATVTITFTEAVTDFTLDDLTAENGTLTGLTTTDNMTFTATFTPTADLDDDTNVITLANTYTDTEGSFGTTATSANYTIDTTPIVVPGKTLYGTFRKDTLTGMNGDDTLFGFRGKDTLSGAGGDDLIYGGWGKDTLNGDDGHDCLHGGWGKDVLNGGAGDDWLHGGQGRDLLTGGDGSDTFVLQRYGGKDTIIDFDLSEDKLGLGRRLGMSQLRFSGEKVLFRGRAIAILEGIDTNSLTANNFESV
ncbi:MAG: leucine-rich repeat protein [Cyanobacteria bacterium J06598_3]